MEGNMTRTAILVHALVKHVPILTILYQLKDPIDVQIRAMTATDDANPHQMVLTVAGLILAGAISGFFQFTYRNVWEDANHRRSHFHLAMGHLTTATHLLVIGVLLLVSVSCLGNFAITSELTSWPFYLAFLLFAALVSYDVFDMMTLRAQGVAPSRTAA
jgi:hypothetical protein